MDGTILDTVDDLRASINYALGRCGHKHDFTREQCKELFGSGVHTALQRALSIEAGEQDQEMLRLIGTPQRMTVPGIDEKEIERIEGVFRPYYLEHSMEHTRPYDGIMDLLRTLRSRGFKTAVVSNKPDPAVRKLAEECFEGLFDVSTGGSSFLSIFLFLKISSGLYFSLNFSCFFSSFNLSLLRNSSFSESEHK